MRRETTMCFTVGNVKEISECWYHCRTKLNKGVFILFEIEIGSKYEILRISNKMNSITIDWKPLLNDYTLAHYFCKGVYKTTKLNI